jgi:hypothetical protein
MTMATRVQRYVVAFDGGESYLGRHDVVATVAMALRFTSEEAAHVRLNRADANDLITDAQVRSATVEILVR